MREKNIYLPVHWKFKKSNLEIMGKFARKTAQTSISLVIDQRYNKKDFDRMAQELKDWDFQ